MKKLQIIGTVTSIEEGFSTQPGPNLGLRNRLSLTVKTGVMSGVSKAGAPYEFDDDVEVAI